MSLSDAERAAGVAAMSAGNHAQGVAHHATRLGIKSIIVMPAITPFTKVRNTRELGGEVILHGETLADAHAFLERSEEHTSELQSLMRISYAVFCLKTQNILQHKHLRKQITHHYNQ